MVGRLPTKCQHRPSPGVEGYPQPPARAETRAPRRGRPRLPRLVPGQSGWGLSDGGPDRGPDCGPHRGHRRGLAATAAAHPVGGPPYRGGLRPGGLGTRWSPVLWEGVTGGPSPRFGYATPPPPPPPPPPPCPPGPLSYQGSIATGHTYGGAQGARKIFFHSPCPRSIPLRPGGGAPQRYT